MAPSLPPVSIACNIINTLCLCSAYSTSCSSSSLRLSFSISTSAWSLFPLNSLVPFGSQFESFTFAPGSTKYLFTIHSFSRQFYINPILPHMGRCPPRRDLNLSDLFAFIVIDLLYLPTTFMFILIRNGEERRPR